MLKLGLCYILLQQLKLLTSMYFQNDLGHILYMRYHSQTFIKGLSTNVWPSSAEQEEHAAQVLK